MKCSEVNAWLDMLMDDELSGEKRLELEEHARVCPQCAESIYATIEMKNMLSEMNDEVDVPLAVQAAWRKAVRREAAHMKARRFYRTAGAVAAAAVVLVGVGFALKGGADIPETSDKGLKATVVNYANEEDTVLTTGISVIESDGTGNSRARVADESADAVKTAMTECALQVENLDNACGYIEELVAEYEGTVEVQKMGTDRANLYITLPSENAHEFMSASMHLDISGQTTDTIEIEGQAQVSLLMILND